VKSLHKHSTEVKEMNTEEVGLQAATENCRAGKAWTCISAAKRSR